ncbi:MAG: hypothetical protein ABID38_04895 [Candidatus Diapherotrites archaeon]
MNKWLLPGIVVAVVVVAIVIIASIILCPADVKLCPDGIYVARSGSNCEFTQCPEPLVCTEETKLCPDGNTVGRNPDLNCEFDLCPTPAEEIKIWKLGIEPDSVPPHYLNQVTFTVLVTGTENLESLRLVESDSEGNILREIGKLKDDGNDPDSTAGDLIYSSSFEIASAEEGKQYYIVQTEVDAYLAVYVSEPVALTITSFPIGPAPSDESFLVIDSETGQKLYSNELIVSFKENVSEDRIREIVSAENASVTGTILSLDVYQLQIEGDGTAEGVKAAVETFESYEEVEYAEPNYAAELN